MTAAAARKQQKDIDIALKKVDDGIDEFSHVWEQATTSSSNSQKEKLGEELKKSINKLQRLRVQIREWIAQSDIKNNSKDKLEEARRRIENDMQRFKEFERDLKTKAFSACALAKADELELEEAEKRKYQEWLGASIQAINDQRDEFEADIEALGNKKSLSNDEKVRTASLKVWQERHQWHVNKLELILRALDNDALDMTDLAIVRESVEYYIEAHGEPDYQHDETLYDCFDLQEIEEKSARPRSSSTDTAKDRTASTGAEDPQTGSSKEEPQRKSKEKEKRKKDDKKEKKKEERERKSAGTPQTPNSGGGTNKSGNASKRGALSGGDSGPGEDSVGGNKGGPPGTPGGDSANGQREERPRERKASAQGGGLDDLATDEFKVQADQLQGEAEEFICKICQIHVVGCSPKLTNCSHLFCGDCLAQWFAQHPESQTWAQRARSAGPERVVPCPVCKQPLNEKRDLYPVCGATSRSENLLLWRMLSSLKIMCVNHVRMRPDGLCDWVGEYGQYQKHAKGCKNLPALEAGATSPTPSGRAATSTPVEVTPVASRPDAWRERRSSEASKSDGGDSTPGDKSSQGVPPAPAVEYSPAASSPPTPATTPSPSAHAAALAKAPPAPAAPAVAPTATLRPASPAAPPLGPQQPAPVTSPSTTAAPRGVPSPNLVTVAAPPPVNSPVLAATAQLRPLGMAAPCSIPASAPASTIAAEAAAPSLPPANAPCAVAPATDFSHLQPAAPPTVPAAVAAAVPALEALVGGGQFLLPEDRHLQQQLPTQTQQPVLQQQPAASQLAPQTQPAQQQKKAAPQAEPEGSFITRATSAFEPTGPNMVHVQLGDTVQVLERHTSGWTYCKNLSSNNRGSATGWAPSWIVQPVQTGDEALSGASRAGSGGSKTPEVRPKEGHARRLPGVAAAPTPQHATQPAPAQQPRPAIAEAGAAAGQATSPTPKAPQTVVRAATAPFTATSTSQLTLASGDLVEIIERDTSGWTYGRKVLHAQQQAADHSAPVEGWFPDWCCAQK